MWARALELAAVLLEHAADVVETGHVLASGALHEDRRLVVGLHDGLDILLVHGAHEHAVDAERISGQVADIRVIRPGIYQCGTARRAIIALNVSVVSGNSSPVPQSTITP